MKEIKTFLFKMDQMGDSGEFTGYAATFGEVDLGGDVVDRGAFKKTLRENRGKVPILDHHDPTRQIGWNMEAREDDRGLFVKGLLDLNVNAARDRHSLMKMARDVGGRTGLSIGFKTIKSEPDKENPLVRHLKEIKLFEYSLVTFPMNPQAAVTTVKAKEELLDHFLRRELGMDNQRAEKAVTCLKSLLCPEPEGHSGSHLARAIRGDNQLEPLLHSLNELLTSFQTK